MQVLASRISMTGNYPPPGSPEPGGQKSGGENLAQDLAGLSAALQGEGLSARGEGLSAADLARENRDRFVAENMRRIFRQIYRLVGNIHDAQDLVQETFIKALQREDQLRDGEKAAHWLSRIATNTALDFLRRHNRVSFCELTEAPESHMETPEATALRSEQRDWLNEGLDKLTGRERAALVLRDVEDLPAEEVARRLDCSKATVRSHIANARIKLKKFAERNKL
jgi:RNA polymerase sigma-70 factor (ECF subfamily)